MLLQFLGWPSIPPFLSLCTLITVSAAAPRPAYNKRVVIASDISYNAALIRGVLMNYDDILEEKCSKGEKSEEFLNEKKARIESLNITHPDGFGHPWVVILSLGIYRTILDKDGKCIDLVRHKGDWFIPTCTQSEDKKTIKCNMTGQSIKVLRSSEEAK
jgi:hypothetical protein